MKAYILILLSIFGLGLIATPDVSTAKQPEINFDEVAEIANLPEIAPISETKIEDIAETAKITTSYSGVTTSSNSFNYTVTVHSGSIVEHPSYSDIYKTSKLLYAHNSSNLFGNLKSLGIGSTFTVTDSGTTKTYVVSDKVTFEKNHGLLQINGSGNYMGRVTYSAGYGNGNHSLALMTCAGTSLGGGDATHRLVIFADEA